MGFITTVFIVVVVIVAILAAVKFLGHGSAQQASVAQAISNITMEIASSYPGASFNITNVSLDKASGGWQIVASILTNSTKPCPSYFVESYVFPEYATNPRTLNNYTSDCNVGGLQADIPYSISSAPVATALSYNKTVDIPAVQSFVSRYGYRNVSVSSKYFNSTVFNGYNFTDVWIVTYTYASNTLSVLLNRTIVLGRINGSNVPVFSST